RSLSRVALLPVTRVAGKGRVLARYLRAQRLGDSPCNLPRAHARVSHPAADFLRHEASQSLVSIVIRVVFAVLLQRLKPVGEARALIEPERRRPRAGLDFIAASLAAAIGRRALDRRSCRRKIAYR